MLKAAVVGVGSMGRNHARVYREMEGSVELVGVADANAGEAAKVGFVPAHRDLAALIATISPYYKRHGLSELVATGGLAMSPDQALAVTRSLLDEVRVTVTR